MKWNVDKIKFELESLTKSLGRFPTTQELQGMGRSDLCNAIRRSGKGTYYFQCELGFPSRKPEGYWLDKIDEELESIINQLGRFPTQSDFQNLGKISIYRAIKKSGQSINSLREKYNFEIKERNKNYWKDWNNLSNELLPLIRDGKFPKSSEIRSKIGGGCLRAIRQFGGMKKVAEKMGCKISYFQSARDGHYVHSYNELVFDEFLYSRGVEHDVDGIIHPDYPYRYDFKIGDFYFEIWGFDTRRKQSVNVSYKRRRTTKENLYSKLGLNLISIEHNVFEQPFEAMEQYFCGLLTSLGFDISRKKEYTLKVINHHKIWDEDKVEKCLKEVIEDDIEKFPTLSELNSIGRSDLVGAINKHGGIFHFAEKMGFDCKKPAGYWTKELMRNKLKEIELDIGYKPTLKQIRKIRSDLACAISEYGGMTALYKE
jgi:hypothetical protein